MTPDPRDPSDHRLDAHIGDVAVERRRSHREPIVAIGRLTPVADDADAPLYDDDGTSRSIKVLVTDVSLHGCDFKTADVPPGDGAYRIELHLGALSLTSRLRVTRVRRRADGTFEVGAEFV